MSTTASPRWPPRLDRQSAARRGRPAPPAESTPARPSWPLFFRDAGPARRGQPAL